MNNVLPPLGEGSACHSDGVCNLPLCRIRRQPLVGLDHPAVAGGWGLLLILDKGCFRIVVSPTVLRWVMLRYPA